MESVQAITSAPDDPPRAHHDAKITEGVTSALTNLLHCTPDALHEDTRLFEELGLDSTGALELLMELEDEFGIEFDPETLDHHHFQTVGSLITFVIAQIAD